MSAAAAPMELLPALFELVNQGKLGPLKVGQPSPLVHRPICEHLCEFANHSLACTRLTQSTSGHPRATCTETPARPDAAGATGVRRRAAGRLHAAGGGREAWLRSRSGVPGDAVRRRRREGALPPAALGEGPPRPEQRPNLGPLASPPAGLPARRNVACSSTAT